MSPESRVDMTTEYPGTSTLYGAGCTPLDFRTRVCMRSKAEEQNTGLELA